MWTRATRSYGRVLRGSGAVEVHYALVLSRSVGSMQTQQRTRRGLASVAPVVPMEPPAVTGKRTRKAVSPKIKEEVRATEAAVVGRTRRAASPKIKEEVVETEVASVVRTRKTASPKIKEEVRETEATGVVLRRSERVWIKSERSAKQEAIAKPEPQPEEEIKDEEGDEESKPKRRKKVVVKRGKDGKPENWEEVLRLIKEMRTEHVADVDVLGLEALFRAGEPPDHIYRFYILICAMLSSQTKDPVNAAAMRRLIDHGLTVKSMLEIDEKELALLIRPVGFYNNKARYIKQVAQILTDKAAETGSEVADIPNTFEDLVALPGVGPKMAHLIMSGAWDNTVGICVDTHVHRISNRLGWVNTWNKKNPKAQDPEKTRKELEDWLPREHWNPINVTLVGLGQTICQPRGPKCGECKVSHLCPSAFSSEI